MERASSPLTLEDLGFGVLFGNIRDAVIVGDAESGQIVLWNPAAEALFGYSAVEAVGMLLEALVPERLREPHRGGLARYVAGGSGPLIEASHPVEVPALRRDGEEIVIELTLNPLEGTKVPGRFVLALIRDATTRQRLERERASLLAAQESEKRFRTAFDSAAVGMALADLDGRFLQVNAALCELTGYTEPELLTKTFTDITHPDDVGLELAQVDQLLAGEIRAYELKKRYLRQDGEIVWIRLSVALVRDERGEPLHLIEIIEDITARKEAETALEGERNLLHALMANVPDPVYFKDAQHRFIRVNPAAAALYGLVDPDAAVGLTDFDVFPEEQARQFSEDERCVLEEGMPLVNRLEQQADAGDASRWTLATKVPIVDAGGVVSGLVGISRDISELVQVEKALRQSEERFRTAFDHAAIGMSLVSLDGRFLQVNAALCALTGYTESDLLATTFQAITYPDDLAADLAQVERLLAGEIPTFHMEKRYVRRDGQILWVRLSSSLVRDEHGAPLHFIGQLEDITARRQTQEKLRRSEARFRSLITNATDLISILAADGTILYESPAIERLLGYDSDELVGSNAWDFIHPDDQAEIWAAFAAALADPALTPTVVFRFQHKDRSWRWMESTGTNLLADEDVSGFVVNSRDVTERKRVEEELREAEAKYRTLVEQLPAVVYIQANDALYTPLFYNSYITILTGETLEEVMARTGPWLDNVHPDDRERLAAADAHAYGANELFSAEFRRRRRDGSYVWVRDEAAPLHDDTGQIIAWQGVMFDITERKLAEEELQAALAGAQAANRAKGVFLDLMSHELRTPLQAVLGYSEFLLLSPQESLTDEQREDIGYIHQAGGRMIALVNQLLDLSRMEAGGIDLAVEPIDLAQVIEAVRQDVAPQAGAKGLALEITLSPTLPPVMGDAERVRQILINLAGNAVKFTSAGHVRITAAPAASGGVEVAVSDTGMGISAESLPHIFEAFHQVESGLTRHQGGSGLGLAIAGRLAEQMGGSISVSSEPNVGSTFTLHLPGS